VKRYWEVQPFPYPSAYRHAMTKNQILTEQKMEGRFYEDDGKHLNLELALQLHFFFTEFYSFSVLVGEPILLAFKIVVPALAFDADAP
jgi:hypothetical protein